MAWAGGAVALARCCSPERGRRCWDWRRDRASGCLGRGFRVTRRHGGGAVAIGAGGGGFYFSPRAGSCAAGRGGFRRTLGRRASAALARQPAHGASRGLLPGHGPEVFTAAFPRYESKALARAYPDFAHESPHNMFLDALVGARDYRASLLLALCVLALQWAWRGGTPWLARGAGGGDREPAVYGVHGTDGDAVLYVCGAGG